MTRTLLSSSEISLLTTVLWTNDSINQIFETVNNNTVHPLNILLHVIELTKLRIQNVDFIACLKFTRWAKPESSLLTFMLSKVIPSHQFHLKNKLTSSKTWGWHCIDFIQIKPYDMYYKQMECYWTMSPKRGIIQECQDFNFSLQ